MSKVYDLERVNQKLAVANKKVRKLEMQKAFLDSRMRYLSKTQRNINIAIRYQEIKEVITYVNKQNEKREKRKGLNIAIPAIVAIMTFSAIPFPVETLKLHALATLVFKGWISTCFAILATLMTNIVNSPLAIRGQETYDEYDELLPNYLKNMSIEELKQLGDKIEMEMKEIVQQQNSNSYQTRLARQLVSRIKDSIVAVEQYNVLKANALNPIVYSMLEYPEEQIRRYGVEGEDAIPVLQQEWNEFIQKPVTGNNLPTTAGMINKQTRTYKNPVKSPTLSLLLTNSQKQEQESK